MLGFAKTHPLLLAWLAAGASGALLTIAGPVLIIVVADLFLPGNVDGAGVATVLNLLMVLFHGSLVAAAVLTVAAVLRFLARR